MYFKDKRVFAGGFIRRAFSRSCSIWLEAFRRHFFESNASRHLNAVPDCACRGNRCKRSRKKMERSSATYLISGVVACAPRWLQMIN